MTLLLVLAALVAYIWYVASPLLRAKRIDAELVPKSMPYSLEDPSRSKRILVLGDSTAVGVGAKPEESVAALLADSLHANVENNAKSGAVVADLVGQIASATKEKYDLVEIQIGANDIVGFRSLSAASDSLDKTLTSLSSKSDHIVFLTAGDIGRAPLFHWPLSAIMSHRTRDLRDRFMQLAGKHNATYIDIYSEPDLFATDPARYHAPDGFHLSAEGYKYWFELVERSLTK